MENNLPQFEKIFSSEEKEILFLTGAPAGKIWNLPYDFWWQGTVFLAAIKLHNEELIGRGHMYFLDENTEVEPFTLYKAKCRELADKTPPKDVPDSEMNYYLITEITGRNLVNGRHVDILHRYKELLVFEDEEFGVFGLDTALRMYIGQVNWLGEECELDLEYDEDNSHSAKDSLDYFKKIYENIDEWDEKLRRYAAEEIEEQYGDKLNLTEEEIEKKIKPRCFSVYSYGGFHVDFKKDDLLREVGLKLDVDEKEVLSSAIIDEQ